MIVTSTKTQFIPSSPCNCILVSLLVLIRSSISSFMRPVSNNKASPSLKFLGGASLQKKLQGFASFVSFQNACFRNGTAMTKLTQERLIADQYFGLHGNSDSVGLSQQLVDGPPVCLHICTTLLTSCNRPVVSSRQQHQVARIATKQPPQRLY